MYICACIYVYIMYNITCVYKIYILFNHKKEGNPAICENTMDLEGIMLNEEKSEKNTV